MAAQVHRNPLSQNSKFPGLPNFPMHSCKLIFHPEVGRAGRNSIIFRKLNKKPQELNRFVPIHQHLSFYQLFHVLEIPPDPRS